MHIALKTALAAAAAAASIAASAQPFAGFDIRSIDQRQARQEQRIEQGVARGELTRQEARTLRQEQRQIGHYEARAKADGHVSRDELRRLTAMVDRADAQIRELRRNHAHRAG